MSTAEPLTPSGREERLEARVKVLERALECFANIASRDELAGMDDEAILRVVYDDREWGDNTVLAELFVRAFRKAAVALNPISSEDDNAGGADTARAGEGTDWRIFVPGCWRCAKCGFALTQSNLNASDGSVTARDEPEICPNDGAPLWRVTWKERAAEAYAYIEERL